MQESEDSALHHGWHPAGHKVAFILACPATEKRTDSEKQNPPIDSGRDTRRNAHLIVADLKVKVLDLVAMRAAPVAAEECMGPDEIERAGHGPAAAVLRHH